MRGRWQMWAWIVAVLVLLTVPLVLFNPWFGVSH